MRKEIEADPDHPRFINTKAGMGYFLQELALKRWD
ncbi:MAG: helix-turn-helix domain-containing protein [Dehalococcoidia bacterium]|nr:helix-turn-helix domain-containing protein [Dehalococcoidia bacterium]